MKKEKKKPDILNKYDFKYVLFFDLKNITLYFPQRQGYPDDYQRANQSAYSDYYAEYPKHYDYGGMSCKTKTYKYFIGYF